jgi:hypothetical protein
MFQSTLLDDILMAQPLNAVVRLERFWALRKPNRDSNPDVTVVIVNFNTLRLIRTTVRAVRIMSPSGTEILVVDNASTDGSRDWLRHRPFDIRPILLPTNLGHGRALDIGALRANGSMLVTLDSDAFPIHSKWLETLAERLSGGAIGAGWKGPRDRLHPAVSAMRRQDYLDLGLSFAVFQLIENPSNPRFGVDCWDTGERISEAIGRNRLALFDSEETPFQGRLAPQLAYHHCGATTLAMDQKDQRRGTRHLELWDSAVDAYLAKHPKWSGVAPRPTRTEPTSP